VTDIAEIVADFIGDYTQAADGKYVFVYGPLVTAMVEGGACSSTTPR